MDYYNENGWIKFSFDPKLDHWLKSIAKPTFNAIHDKENQNEWLRCQGTWFAGVRALPNDIHGSVKGGVKLDFASSRWALNMLGVKQIVWDPAQISVCYPGYPKPGINESKSSFYYRLKKDAAHVDGLHPVGKNRIRMLREQHAFILGIPVTTFSRKASPLVVWEGSHKIMKYYFKKEFCQIDPQDWKDYDFTKVYHNARNEIFDTCKRVEIHATPGESYIVHRMALHGVAPWDGRARSSKEGRVIVYFRPDMDLEPSSWLTRP